MRKYRNINYDAFSLVELMVVIVIIGVLSAVAVPSYLNYARRSKVAHAFSLAEKVKQDLEQFYSINGRFPNSSSEITYTKNNINSIIQSIMFYGCAETNVDRFSIAFTNAIDGTTGYEIVLQVWETNNIFYWGCRQAGNPPIPIKYIPANCITSGQAIATWPTCTGVGGPTL